MSPSDDAPLERLFHDPTRLAILSAVLEDPAGASFTSVREACGLSDGNLLSHLRALENAGTLSLTKEIRDNRACTVIAFTDAGRVAFLTYLENLEKALKRAAAAAGVLRSPRATLLTPDANRA